MKCRCGSEAEQLFRKQRVSGSIPLIGFEKGEGFSSNRWSLFFDFPFGIPLSQKRSLTLTQFSHLDEKGDARMVDVSDKAETVRSATATGKILLSPETVAALRDNAVPKGDVLATARIAGIMAAKKTSELIPLCHPLPITKCTVDLQITDTGVSISATIRVTGKTGVEMEALTSVSVAALTVYDMVKALDKSATITDIRLETKTGGKSGDFTREPV